MKAYVLQTVNNLIYRDWDIPAVPADWALIQVKAAGICSSDLPRIFEKGTYHFPTIPGHEFSGYVVKVANREHETWVGKKVGVFPLIPCRKCPPCLHHHYEMCQHYDYIGSRRDGAFAEYVAVPVWNLMELPDSISCMQAALMEPLAVALHAIKKIKREEISHLAIIGTGMIAFACAQWALKYRVPHVTIIGRSQHKQKIAAQIPGLCYATSPTYSQPFDAVVEAVGTVQAVTQAIGCVRPGGQVVLMGNPSADMGLPQEVYWKILRHQLHLLGTWNSCYEQAQACDWTEVRAALVDHSLQTQALISHVFRQDQLLQALQLMRTHQEPYCKVMTLWN